MLQGRLRLFSTSIHQRYARKSSPSFSQFANAKFADAHAVGSSFFNPAVVRHLKRAQQDLAEKRLSPNHVVSRAVINSDNYLRYLAKIAHKIAGNNIRRNIIPPHISKPETFDGLTSLESDAELQACAAASIVLLPSSWDTWHRLDNIFALAIEKRAAWGDFQSFEVPLLCSYAMLIACTERGFQVSSFKTPTMVMKMLSDKCNIELTLDSIFPNGQPSASQAAADALSSLPHDDRPAAALTDTLDTIVLELPIGGNLFGPPLPRGHDDLNTNSSSSSRVQPSSGADGEYLGLGGTASAAIKALMAPPKYDEITARETIDQLAICMFVIAQVKAQTPKESNKLLLSLVTLNLTEVLLTLRTPTEISRLRYIWESAAELQLANSYALYKGLYEAVLVSLRTDPLQMAHQEEAVATLLESMVRSRFKNSQLIAEIGMVIKAKGSRFEHCGARLFNALVALDSMPLALDLLDKMMKRMSEMPQASRVLYGASFGMGKGGSTFLSLSQEGLLRIEDFLEASGASPSGYTTSGLLLALHCFSREVRGSRYYQLLMTMEAEMNQKIASLSLHEVLNTLHAYGSVTRNHPLVSGPITDRIAAAIEDMNKMELQMVLWANARLNLKPPYLERAAQRFFSFFSANSGIKTLSSTGYRQVIVTLWSLAVLQCLTYEQYMLVEPLLLDAYRRQQRPDGKSPTPAAPALFQVVAELRFAAAKQEQKLSSEQAESLPAEPSGGPLRPFPLPVARSALTVDGALSCAISGSLPTPFAPIALPSGKGSVWDERPWEKRRGFQAWMKSSISHMKLSGCLTRMGVPHINEAEIGYGYIVDILIPGAVPGGSNGIIIEVDGPFHFESYLQQPIGPTVMKRRHLEAMGFHLVSIPYTSWQNIHGNADKIKAMLGQHLVVSRGGPAVAV